MKVASVGDNDVNVYKNQLSKQNFISPGPHQKQVLNQQQKVNIVLPSEIQFYQPSHHSLPAFHLYNTLYYKLLSYQLPLAKISTTLKSVLKSFLPSLDVDKLKLPGESCASYMRKEELTTVNSAHNAASLLESNFQPKL